MKRHNKKRFFRLLMVLFILIISLSVCLFISLNFIVNPVIYWLASTEGVRIFISCILSWIGLNKGFDFFYKRYKRQKKVERFNALKVPYPRIFRGRS